jgi:UDP-glucose 6-dehydrogenase
LPKCYYCPITFMDFPNKETVVIVGFGWVGQANALALTHADYEVFYFDVGKPTLKYADKYEHLYNKVKPLSSVLEKDSVHTWYIVSVGDRVLPDGEQDISLIKKALESLKNAKGGIVLRSTILPEHLKDLHFDYYVPEFLHEKKAVEESIYPQYFILGKKTERVWPSFFELWDKRATKGFHGTPEEASYIKYLSNTWNAIRIAFVNEFGNAMSHPTDQEKLASNERIIDFFFERKAYMRYGRSYGGHCLPKDTHAFLTSHKKQGKDVSLMEGMHHSNLAHQEIEKKHGNLPEWFSEWYRPVISGRAALRALKSSIARNIKKPFAKKKVN